MGIPRSHNAAAPRAPRPSVRPAQRLRRAVAAAALAAAGVVLISGCGVWPFHGGPDPDPTASPRHVDAARVAHDGADHDVQERVARLRAEQTAAPADPAWPTRIGAAYAVADSAAPAEAALRQALALDATYPPALSLLSSVLFGAHRNQEAVDLLESARQRGVAESPELLAGLALHYEALGEHDRAEQLVASLRAPGAHWAHDGSALTYVALRGDEPAQATDFAKQALSADPKTAANYNNFGITQLHAGDPHGARTSFLKALELHPELPGALYNLAIVDRFYLFDSTAARAWFDRYWALSHEDPDHLSSVFAEPGEQRPVALEGR